MRRFTILVTGLSLLALALSGCVVVPRSVVGSGTMETRDFDLSGFTAVDAGHAFQVKVVHAPEFGLTVTFDDNLEPYLEVRKSGETLLLGLKDGNSYTNMHLSAELTMPSLDALDLSGSSEAIVAAFSSSRPLDVTLSGSSNLTLVACTAGDVDMNISGSSTVGGALDVAGDAAFDLSGSSNAILQGMADGIRIDASGSSDIRFQEFSVRKADVKMSGASNAWLAVSDELRVDLSGASNVLYYGDPSIKSVDLSGSSTVEQG